MFLRTHAAIRIFPYYDFLDSVQTRFILDNLKKTFAAAAARSTGVVKPQVFLTDLDNFYAFDEVWKE